MLTYLLGADSQMALAALVKGRSSSDRINALLEESLPTILRSDIYENYRYVPSLANGADDPTRDRPLRRPMEDPPDWLVDALEEKFEKLTCG